MVYAFLRRRWFSATGGWCTWSMHSKDVGELAQRAGGVHGLCFLKT